MRAAQFTYDGCGWSDPTVSAKPWSHYEPGDSRFDGVPTFHERTQQWICPSCKRVVFTEEFRQANRISFEPDPESREHIDGFFWNGECYENIRRASMDAQRESDRRYLDSLPRRSTINWTGVVILVVAVLLLARFC